MFTAPIPAAYIPHPSPVLVAMRPALDFAADNTWVYKLQQETQKTLSISDRLLLKLVRSSNKSLAEINQATMKMNAESAQALLSDLTPYEKLFESIRESLESVNIGNNASELDKAIFHMINCLVEVFSNLKVIADPTPVDESSPSYQVFLEKMVADAETSPRVYGRKALFALFEN